MPSKPDLLVTMPLTSEDFAALSSYFNVYDQGNPQGLLARGILTNPMQPVDKDLLNQLSQVQIIACSGIGVDNIDLIEAERRGIVVTNVSGVLEDTVANHAIALLLALTRRIISGDQFVRKGQWLDGVMGLSSDIIGKKCGIVGLGVIGKAIAKRVEALGMDVAYYGRHRQDVPYTYFDNIENMADACEVLMLSVPGALETKHLINGAVLAALGPKGYLINVARGSVVDEVSLISVLQNQQIAGAGLDVFENEPKVPPQLLALDNVVLSPHIASGTYETRALMLSLAIKNLHAFFSGNKLLNPVITDKE